ncbi:Ppx/GppA phosphatase family protein [Chondromyces apiculatus]|uniref:Ppx/GppA phosphatase family protein n=1 Tax=Chondromyces apiculatus TaxID=51 RepID=UPI001E578F4C|nr:Ppx/GppA family phosphatase [Chondromyces apiculatus]
MLLLIAEQSATELVPLVDRATITRLGQGVDRTGALSPDAVERTLSCLARYGEEIRRHTVDRVDAVGTSAMRDAVGTDTFLAQARHLIGTTPRVISGEEEAALSFQGAMAGISANACPCIVFDVGGGSTEIIANLAHERPDLEAFSLNIGSVRLTERHVRTDPPAHAELEAIRADIRAALTSVHLPSPPRDSQPLLVGVAGTVTTIATLALNLDAHDAPSLHGAKIGRKEVEEVAARVASLPLARRRQLQAIDPARADVIVAGSMIVEELLRWSEEFFGQSSSELTISGRGVRWGLALQLAGLA